MPQKPKPPSQVTFEEFWRRAVFGIICGTVTGFTVGAVDAYKLFKGGTVKQADFGRVAFHEMGRSAVIVAGFFGIYQTVKTGLGFVGVDYPEVKVGTATDDWCCTIINHARFTTVRALRFDLSGRGHVPLRTGRRARTAVVSFRPAVCAHLVCGSCQCEVLSGSGVFCGDAHDSGFTRRWPVMLQDSLAASFGSTRSACRAEGSALTATAEQEPR